MKAILAAAAIVFLLAATPTQVRPMAARAISVQENGKRELRAVILQLDENRAVVSMPDGTFGLTTEGGEMKAGVLDKLPMRDLFQFGNTAPLKRGVVVVCGTGDPQT